MKEMSEASARWYCAILLNIPLFCFLDINLKPDNLWLALPIGLSGIIIIRTLIKIVS